VAPHDPVDDLRRQSDSAEQDSLTGRLTRRGEVGPAASMRPWARTHSVAATELRAGSMVALRSGRAKAARAAWAMAIRRWSMASVRPRSIGMLARRALGAGKASVELGGSWAVLVYPLNRRGLAGIELLFTRATSVLGPEAVAVISVIGALAALNAVTLLGRRLSRGEALPRRGLRWGIAIVASGRRRVVVGHVGGRDWVSSRAEGGHGGGERGLGTGEASHVRMVRIRAAQRSRPSQRPWKRAIMAGRGGRARMEGWKGGFGGQERQVKRCGRVGRAGDGGQAVQATEALAKSLSFGESMPARPRPGIGRDCKTKT
jgi:hypothetical protein